MAILERHLFGPGPGNPYAEATAGLGLPLLGHLDQGTPVDVDTVLRDALKG